MEAVIRRVAKFSSGRPGAIRSAVAGALGLAALATVVGCQGQSAVAVRDKPEAPVFSGLPSGTAASTEATAAAKARLAEGYGKLPLHFEPNRGQADARIKFLSRGSGYTLFLTPSEAVLALRRPESGPSRVSHKIPARPGEPANATRTVLRVRLVGGNPDLEIKGLEELPGKSNYFLGNDPKKWRTNIPTYAKLKYQDVYPGIDLFYYGHQRQLEYDFVVAAGADPGLITLAFEGADKLEIDARGNLVVGVAGGEVMQYAPLLYQEGNGVTQPVRGRYALKGGRQVGFEVAAYDAGKPLVIDPVLSYSTYLGGGGGEISSPTFCCDNGSIAVDASGNAYVTGFTTSSDFPTTASSFQPAFGGISPDVYVVKFNSSGSALVYSTYLGGGVHDIGLGIAVDAAGNAYLTGLTGSGDFPTTQGVFQPAFAGGTDAFVTVLNPEGSALVYSSYLGGSGLDHGNDIAVDGDGNAYVTGETQATNFPTTPGAYQPAFAGGFRDAFVTKVNATGSAIVYSSYLGGGAEFSQFFKRGSDIGYGIAVDAAGNAYVTGETVSTEFPTVNPFQSTYGGLGEGGFGDAFVTKFNSTGSALLYSTFLGGNSDDLGLDIAVDAAGNAYVTGFTGSLDFPTVDPFQAAPGGFNDAFVTKLNSTGSALVYATYLGGSGFERGLGIAVDAAGNAYVTGDTSSPDFPTVDPFQAARGGFDDAFVTKLNSTGSALVYSSYLGGSASDSGIGIAVDAAGNAYVTGDTESTNFPTVNPFQAAIGGNFDAFVAKIADIGTDVIINPMPWLELLLLDD